MSPFFAITYRKVTFNLNDPKNNLFNTKVGHFQLFLMSFCPTCTPRGILASQNSFPNCVRCVPSLVEIPPGIAELHTCLLHGTIGL